MMNLNDEGGKASDGPSLFISFIWFKWFEVYLSNQIPNRRFFSTDKRFLCLGSWDHFDSNSPDRFLALMDMNEDPVDRPKYRCGVSSFKSDFLIKKFNSLNLIT